MHFSSTLEASDPLQTAILNTLFEQAPVGVAILDTDLCLLHCNPTWAHFIERYTLTPAERIRPGTHFYELAPGTQATFDPILEAVLQGESVKLDALRSESDGIVSYWSTAFSPLLEEGRVIGILDIVSDATEQVLSVQELEKAATDLIASENHLRSLVENATDFALYRIALEPGQPYDGRVVMVSPSLGDIVGTSNPNDFRSWFANLHPDDRARVEKAHRQSIETGEIYDQAARFYHQERSEWVWVHTISTPSYDQHGTLTHFNGIVVDVTPEKRADEALQHQLAFEKIITTLSAQFINLAPEQIDDGIQRALETIGRFADVDRSYVFLYSSDGTTMDNTHEWCASGITPQQAHMQNILAESMAWSNAILQNSQVLYIPRLADLPLEAAAERRDFSSQGTLSLIAVPLTYQGHTVGFLGFDAVRHEVTWSEASIRLLRMVGEILISALELKRSHAIQAGQFQFLELLATGGGFSETLHALVGIIEKQWPGMVGLVLLLDDEGRLHHGASLSLPADYIDSIEGLEIGPMVGSCGTACYWGERVIVEDIRADPRWDSLRDIAVSSDLGACWSEPVFSSQGRVIGTFAMYYRHRRAPTEGEIRTIEIAAHLVGIAIEQKQAREALHESQRALTTLMGNLPGMAYRCAFDFDRPMEFLSEGSHALTGYTPDELLDEDAITYSRLIPLQDRQRIWDEIQSAVAARLPYRLTYPIVTADGQLKWIWEQGCGVYGDDNRVLALEGFATDITERVMAQQNLELRVSERTRELSTLLEVSHKVTSTLELQPLLGLILDELIGVIECAGASILTVDDDDLVVSAYRGPIPDEIATNLRLRLDQSPVNQEVIRRRQAVIIADVRGTDALALLFQQTAGPALDTTFSYIRSWLGVPLMVRDRLVGMLTLDHSEPNHYAPQHSSLATTFANQVAVAIDNARLYQDEMERREEAQRRRRVAEGLRDVLAILNSDMPLDQVLDYIVEQSCQLMGACGSAIHHVEQDKYQVTIEAGCGMPIPVGTPRPTTRIYDGYADRAIFSGQPYAIPDLRAYVAVLDTPQANELDPEERIWRKGIRELSQEFGGYLAVPLEVGDDVYGSLVFFFHQPRDFTDEDISLATALGDQAALAIENARLRAQVKETAATAERSRLARDLHDAVTQTLFSSSLIAEVLPRLWERNPDEARRRLEELRQLNRGALAEMRTLLLELRPAVLEDTNLGDLLKQLGDATTGRARIPVAVTVTGECAVPVAVKIALYRIAQEALNNVAKHAAAGQVAVSLQCSPGRVKLQVHDDGRGFDLGHASPESLGLGIMRERALAIGAELKIDSQPDLGSTVSVIWLGADPAAKNAVNKQP